MLNDYIIKFSILKTTSAKIIHVRIGEIDQN